MNASPSEPVPLEPTPDTEVRLDVDPRPQILSKEAARIQKRDGTAPKRNFVSLKGQLAIRDKLQELLIHVGQDPEKPDVKLFDYIDDWTDTKVAESMEFRCTEANVGGVRRELFGPLRKVAPPSHQSRELVQLREQIAALAHRVEILEEHLRP
jgi:hypothetical protein